MSLSSGKTVGWNPRMNVVHKKVKSKKPTSTTIPPTSTTIPPTTSIGRSYIDRIINAEEVTRDFIMDEENSESCLLLVNGELIVEICRTYEQLSMDEFEERRLIEELRSDELLANHELGNALAVQNGLAVFEHFCLYVLGYRAQFPDESTNLRVLMTGSWLCCLLTGLPVKGVVMEAITTTTVPQVELTLMLDQMMQEPTLLKVASYEMLTDMSGHHRTTIVYTNGVTIELDTDAALSSLSEIGFNLNNLTFDIEKGITRRCLYGSGMNWASILLGLYNRTSMLTGSSCFDQEARLLNLGTLHDANESDSDYDSDDDEPESRALIVAREKAITRGLALKSMVKYSEMSDSGIICSNFSPPIGMGGECVIEQGRVEGLTVRTRCGHLFGLDNLIKNVSECGRVHAKCPLCREFLAFDC